MKNQQLMLTALFVVLSTVLVTGLIVHTSPLNKPMQEVLQHQNRNKGQQGDEKLEGKRQSNGGETGGGVWRRI